MWGLSLHVKIWRLKSVRVKNTRYNLNLIWGNKQILYIRLQARFKLNKISLKLPRCWFYNRPASQTMSQYWTNIIEIDQIFYGICSINQIIVFFINWNMWYLFEALTASASNGWKLEANNSEFVNVWWGISSEIRQESIFLPRRFKNYKNNSQMFDNTM